MLLFRYAQEYPGRRNSDLLPGILTPDLFGTRRTETGTALRGSPVRSNIRCYAPLRRIERHSRKGWPNIARPVFHS